VDSQKLIRRRGVEAVTGLSRSALYAKVASGAFPKPIKLGCRSVAWISGEVDDWIRTRIKEGRGGGKPVTSGERK
jgi:prophage regulatory protein